MLYKFTGMWTFLTISLTTVNMAKTMLESNIYDERMALLKCILVFMPILYFICKTIFNWDFWEE